MLPVVLFDEDFRRANIKASAPSISGISSRRARFPRSYSTRRPGISACTPTRGLALLRPHALSARDVQSVGAKRAVGTAESASVADDTARVQRLMVCPLPLRSTDGGASTARTIRR